MHWLGWNHFTCYFQLVYVPLEERCYYRAVVRFILYCSKETFLWDIEFTITLQEQMNDLRSQSSVFRWCRYSTQVILTPGLQISSRDFSTTDPWFGSLTPTSTVVLVMLSSSDSKGYGSAKCQSIHGCASFSLGGVCTVLSIVVDWLSFEVLQTTLFTLSLGTALDVVS